MPLGRWTLSMTARIGTPLQHSRNKSRICTASVALGPAQASSELIQSLNVRASRVSPASSRSNPASSLATSSSTASKPGRSLKSCATNARLSFEFAAATSLALMNGAKKRPALSRTCCARFVRSGTLRSTGLISEPYLRRAPVSTEVPRPSRGVTRLHGISTSQPRRPSRGVTRFHGISTSQPRRRRDLSAEYPHGEKYSCFITMA